MPLLRFPKTFEQTHIIRIGKLLKRVDSDCILLVFWTLPNHALECFFLQLVLPLNNSRITITNFFIAGKTANRIKLQLNAYKILEAISL